MTDTASLSINRTGEQVVRPPRRTDAVGEALRGAYVVGEGLPTEMAALLRRLNEHQRPN